MRPDEAPDADPDPQGTSGQATAGEGIHLEAHASGEASIHQAGRDQHIHYVDDTHHRLRTASGSLVRACPYPGLVAFGPEQAKWFFGRDGLIAELTARLDQRLRTGGMQVVVAPSGAGKSSLLRAGLLPKLEQAALPGSDRWPKLALTPGAEPVSTLAVHIAARTGAEPGVVTEQLIADPRECLSTLRPSLGGPLPAVLVVDQFEELFTLCTDDHQRRTFIDLLTRIAGSPPDVGASAEPAGLVILGLRADFYATCVGDSRLRAALQDTPLVVGPMSEAELREAIVFPAQDVGLDIEPGLVELLLRDLGATARVGADETGAYEAGRLPLLAHALRVSWQNRHGATLTVLGYQDTGGIQHAVATTADQVYDGLDETGRRLAQSLFLRLIKVGDVAEDTRRRVPRAELVCATADPPRAALVLDAFTQARLLTLQLDTAEITHEALLHSWPRLRRWIDADRASRLTHQNLEESAAAWERAHRDPALLYRGSQLDTAHTWATTAAPGEPSPIARTFLAAASQARRRATRWKTGITVALAVLLVAAVTAAVVAFQQRGAALQQRDLVLYNQILANSDRLRTTDVSLSAQLALVAHRIRPSDETYTRLVTAADSPLSTPLTGHANVVGSVAFSPDGHTMATGSNDYTIRLWNVADPTRPTAIGQLAGHTDGVAAVAFSPDGRTLATGSVDRTVRLWNVADPTRPIALGQPDPARPAEQGRPLTGNVGRITSVAFSPDGHTLAAGNLAASGVGDPLPVLRLWNVSDPARPVLLSQPFISHIEVDSVAFSPDGHTLAASCADGVTRLWNIADPTQPIVLGEPLTGHTDYAFSVAFSPDGRTLAVGSRDQSVQLWNVADPTRPAPLGRPLTGHTGGVYALAFSPDGRTLTVGSGDFTVRLWNFSDPTSPAPLGQPLTGHTGTVNSVAFSPDGHTLATGSDDHTARLWHLPSPLLTGHTTVYSLANAVHSVAFSPNGRTLAAGTMDKLVRLSNVADPSRPAFVGQPLQGHTLTVCSVAFSPDGHTLATGSFDGTARLWNVADPTRPAALGQPLTGHTDNVCALAFSPDGHTLATGSLDDSVQLWNVSDPTRPTALGPPLTIYGSSVNSVAFSPNGRILAAGTRDSTVRLWNVADPRQPTPLGAPLTGHTDAVYSVAFSPDGHTLATGSADDTVRLWNVANPNQPTALGVPLTGHTSYVGSVAFSPDGHTLATGSADHTVRLWNTADPTRPAPLGQPLTGHTSGVSSVAFSPDGRTLATGSGDQSIRLWDMNVDQNIEQICAATRNTLTTEQWQRYVSDIIPYHPPC
ncbi:MAG TPA: WD40 repeat domain-containing protein [Amycolatopsis sp.]|uniref:NACHT and WD repeat domain-containing protein n=1 Tax=Amycolatopsis sp. TaxID=37632 RepID=UPI002B4A1605|nr:WD40 repeat domain-containing protein [Amycolatopsis sp.]HKS49847.1 WD40 repeat domain-containing protein [Amycolatopsis sp.]